ncbi:MAG: 2-oxoglutarate and iron-dependent oxygenase domain-containing protein [Pseudomonadota bacterium]
MHLLEPVSLSPLASTNNPKDHDYRRTLQALEHACVHVGFLLVKDHAIPKDLIVDLRNAIQQFFLLPLADKQSYRISRGNYRGYIPLGFFDSNEGDYLSDRYEGYKLHLETSAEDPVCQQCDLYGPNIWPSELPALKTLLLRYWSECDRLRDLLLNAFANILGLPDKFFAARFASSLTNMTLLHYPPRPSDLNDDQFGIHPHKDTDVLTILAPDDVGGLWLKPRGHQHWVSAQAPEDCMIVNIGDMLEIWSGGYFMSTPHKVVSPTEKSRFSFPYFAVPRFDTFIEPMCALQPGFERAGIHCGDVSREVWRTNWPAARSEYSSIHLGTLQN